MGREMNLIGICGRAGAGKSTAAAVLVKEFGYVEVALADPMKRICKEVFDFSDEQLWGPSEKRNAPDKRYPRLEEVGVTHRMKESFLTPRYALQTLGTEWGRHCYDDVWIDHAIRVAGILLDPSAWSTSDPDGQWMYNPQESVYKLYFNRGSLPKHMGVVISDIRFPNEVAAIKKAGGRIWKIERPEKSKSILRREAIMQDQPMPDLADWRRHTSESYADGIEADLNIANVGSLEVFQSMVRDLASP
jgi:hypothetical protein